MSSICKHFDALNDPRFNDWNVHHKLGDILTIALCAVLGGAEGWEDIETFGTAKRAWFDKRLELKHGMPSADTFRRVISVLDPDRFGECFLGWVREAVDTLHASEHDDEDIVALDGKTLRGSYEDGDPKATIHMVSAWASANEMVVAQVKVANKSNEITAIPKLLAMLYLRGCIVTIDAMGCQTDIAEQIDQAGADYVLALKGNQGNLHADVREYFEEGKKRGFEALPVSQAEHTTVAHGRKEVRRCVVSTDVEWLAGYEKWANLTSIALVEYCRDTYTAEATYEQRFYISSASLETEAMLNTVRRHWEIENKVHWVLDVSFGEDASRIRREDGAENFSRLRRMALNLLRHDDTAKREGIKGRRKQAGWDNQYLERLIES